MSITIKGHSVRTRNEQFDRSASLGMGEVGRPDIGVAMAASGVEAVVGVDRLFALESGAAVSPLAGVDRLSPDAPSFSGEEISIGTGPPLVDFELGGGDPAASAGNEKFRCTAEGRVLYVVWTKSRNGCT